MWGGGRGRHRGSDNLLRRWEPTLELVLEPGHMESVLSLEHRVHGERQTGEIGKEFGPRSQRTLKSRFKNWDVPGPIVKHRSMNQEILVQSSQSTCLNRRLDSQ